jgi:probable rRNA maturation factor
MAPSILVCNEHVEGAAAARALARLAARFLLALDLADAQLSLVVTTDRRIRNLNREFRDHDEPTDVLSFPAAASPRPKGRPRPLGDVVVSLDTARRSARQLTLDLGDELARYLAHGLLHLCGHDHADPRQARRMARAEAKLLDGAGLLQRVGR